MCRGWQGPRAETGEVCRNLRKEMILKAALQSPRRSTALCLARCRLARAFVHRRSHMSIMAPAAPREVHLTEQEKELFAVLKAVVAHSSPSTVLRCAGGWVRDKLLGKDSHDIDIALSDKKGAEFAEDINAYLASQAQSTLKVAITSLMALESE